MDRQFHIFEYVYLCARLTQAFTSPPQRFWKKSMEVSKNRYQLLK